MKTEVDDLADKTRKEFARESIQLDKYERQKGIETLEHGKDDRQKHGKRIKVDEKGINILVHGEEIRQKHRKKVKGLQKTKKHREEFRDIKYLLKVQNEYTIKQWRSNDTVFYETTGYTGALELLNSKKYVTIIGSPGAGKSAIAQHIALRMENEGWEVIPVDDPEDINRYGSVCSKKVFVIDDVIGVFNVDISRLDAILRKKQEILHMITFQTIKLIMTCRKVVYNEVKNFKSLVTEFVIDLDTSQFQLNVSEKKGILLNHCKEARISQELYDNIPLSNAQIMFPLLCKIFCKEQRYQSVGKQFFEKPYECLLEKLEDLRKQEPLQYAGLILLCLTKKITLSKEICESNETFFILKKTVFDIYGVNYETSASEIIKALSLLDGTYTRPSSDGFTFIHDSIFELVAYHHGKSYPEHILKYSSSSYVNSRVTVDEPPSDGGLYIKLQRTHYPLLADRLLQDIQAFKLYNVFNNSSLKNDEFSDAFIKILHGTGLETFKKVLFKPCPEPQESYASDEFDTSEYSNESETDTFTSWEQLEEEISKLYISDECDISEYSDESETGTLTSREQLQKGAEFNTSECSDKSETDTYIWSCKRKLLEKDDTRVIRWIVFYGPTSLLEFVIEHVEIQERKSTFNYIAKHATKNNPDESLFGKKEEQTRLLVIGCLSGDVDRVRLILQCINHPCVNTIVHIDPHFTPLTSACYCGHLPVVDVLIQHGAGVDIRDIWNYTPLYYASERGHCDIVRYLIDHGADPNLHKLLGNTPLRIASKKGHCDIVRYLIDNGADPNLPKYSNKPLYIASERGHCDIVRYLIDHGADPNLHECGKTPLYVASERGHCDIVRYLIDHGADPNLYRKYGDTPLYIASKRGHRDIVKYLLDHGSDPNIIGQSGDTPLYIASERGHSDNVKYLLDHGSDPNLPGQSGDTPLYIASKRGHSDIIRQLTNYNADPNITNTDKHDSKNRISILKDFETCISKDIIKRLYFGVDRNGVTVIAVVIDNNFKAIVETFQNFPVVCQHWGDTPYETMYAMNCEESFSNMLNHDTSCKIEKCISKHSESLMRQHSNLEIISASSVKSRQNGDKIEVIPCIVLYCSHKGIIPCGENLFPQEIDGIQVDVREGFFYSCPLDGDNFFKSSKEMHETLRMGCNIGPKDQMQVAGTLGGFVDLPNNELGFITCAHVLQVPSSQQACPDVVQPSYGINGVNNVCGSLIKSACPVLSSTPRGTTVDAALVKVTSRHPERGLFAGLSVSDLNPAGFSKEKPPEFSSGEIRDLRGDVEEPNRFKMCFKCGSASGLTRGILHLNATAVRKDSYCLTQTPTTQCTAYSHLEIRPPGGEIFASKGDSGAFVFQVKSDSSNDVELVCIGMVIGVTSHHYGIVTPIRDVLDALGLQTLHKFDDENMIL